MKKIFITVVISVVPGICLAASGDERIAEMYMCELKDGKTMEEVQANNVKWLANTRKQAGNEDIHSYALEPMVGNLEHFYFIDSYPDLATWSAAKAAESDEGQAIEDAFNELMECTKNRLYKGTQH